MINVCIIGAGKTGRGFIARLASESDISVTFIDKNPALVDSLNSEKQFTVSYFGNVRSNTVISNFTAHTWDTADLRYADVIFVSVGGQNLTDVGAALAEKLPSDAQPVIICCENASSPAEKLTAAMGRSDLPVSEATVFCTTIENGGLDIASENYPYLQCDRDRLMGREIPIAAIRPVDRFADFLTRKLFTYNSASCVIAYLGAVKGHTSYAEAANDPAILALLDKNYTEVNTAMCAEFGYAPSDQAEFALLSRTKFTSREIIDTVERNARDVSRKLAPGERILGIMDLMKKHGADTSVMEMTVAAAILYTLDPKWNAYKADHSTETILRDFCHLTDSDQISRILSHTKTLPSALAPLTIGTGREA